MKNGDHVRPRGGRLVHAVVAPAKTTSGLAGICGFALWPDGHVTSEPVTCKRCARR